MPLPEPTLRALARHLEPVLRDMAFAIDRGATDTDRTDIAQVLIAFIDGYDPQALEAYVEAKAERTNIGDVIRAILGDAP